MEITQLMEEKRSKGDQNEAALKTMTQNQQVHDLLVVEFRKLPASSLRLCETTVTSKASNNGYCLFGSAPPKSQTLNQCSFKIVIIGTCLCFRYPPKKPNTESV